MSKTIIISAYRNVSIRYILKSTIGKTLLKNRKIKLIVLVKSDQIKHYNNEYSNYQNIEFLDVNFEILFKELRSPLGSFFNLYRMLTCPSNELSKNETINIFLKTYQKEWVTSNKRSLLFILIKLFAFLGSKIKIIRFLMIKIEGFFFNGKIYFELFKKYKPSLLIVSSVGHMIDVNIMNAANSNNVKVLTIFHNWDGPTTKGYKSSIIDYAVSWNKIMTDEIINYQDLLPKNIFLGGAVNYEKYFIMKDRDEFRLNNFNKKPNKSRKLIYAPGGSSLWPKNFEPLYHILKNNNKNNYNDNLEIVLRIHPNSISLKDSKNKIILKEDIEKVVKDLKKMYPVNFSISIPKVNFFQSDYYFLKEDLTILGELLNSADIIITQYSTLLLEAAIFDLPAINIGYGVFRNNLAPANFYEKSTHIKTLMKFDSYYSAYSSNQLDTYINQYLKNPKDKKSNRISLVNEMFSINKNIGKNIAHHIEQLVF